MVRSRRRMSLSPSAPTSAPMIPSLLQDEIGVFQVHASRYSEPDQLPPGAVLVVGSGAFRCANRRRTSSCGPPRVS